MYIRLCLLFIFLIGIHSKIRLFSDEQVLIPNVLAFIVGFIFALIHLPKFFKKEARYLYFIALFFFISIFFGPNNSFFLKEKFLGFLQMITSLIVGFSLFYELKRYSLNQISKFSLVLISFFLAGSIIEILTPFKYFHEDIMRPLYPPNAFYYSGEWNLMRDINYYFFYRPKFLTTEPSYLGQTLSMLILFWYLSSSLRNKNIIFFILLLISFIIVRSPMILFLVPIYASHIISISSFKIGKKTIYNTLLSIVFIVLISFVSLLILEERINVALAGLDFSLIMRILGPIFTTYNVLIEYPFFGVGIESKEATLNIMIGSFLNFGLQSSQSFEIGNIIEQNHAYFMKFFLYFGLLGTSTLFFLFKKLLFNIHVNNTLFVFLTFSILGFTHGNITGLNTWSYFFIICSIISLVESQKITNKI